MKRHLISLCAFLVFLTLALGSSDNRGSAGSGVSIRSQASKDSLSQMEIAFVGDHSRSRIKTRIDRAMILYSLPITGDNYSRAGSVLVALRKEYGVSEMDILDYMIRSYVEGVNMSFSDAAAIASVALIAERR